MPISSRSDIEVKFKQLESLISAYVLIFICINKATTKAKATINKTLFK